MSTSVPHANVGEPPRISIVMSAYDEAEIPTIWLDRQVGVSNFKIARWKTLYGALAVIAFMGCTAASYSHAFLSQRTTASAQENPAIRAPTFQRGIDVDAYTYRGEDVSAAAAAVVAYVRQLRANSLSISFPFFMKSRRSSDVFATRATPTPAQLGLFIADAERARLYVSIRPLLSEFQIGGNRTTWRPGNLRAWFASYRRFLLPYARMAQSRKVGMFFVGAEFQRFGRSPLWNSLDRALARVFHGRLAYSNNGPGQLSRSTGGRAARKTVDSYPSMNPPFLRGWKAYDRKLPRRTILTELSIGAWDGAWRAPWQTRLAHRRFNPQVQARWFTAACHAARATGLRGIYFWALALLVKNSPPTPLHPGAWAHSAGATAITRCFRTRS